MRTSPAGRGARRPAPGRRARPPPRPAGPAPPPRPPPRRAPRGGPAAAGPRGAAPARAGAPGGGAGGGRGGGGGGGAPPAGAAGRHVAASLVARWPRAQQSLRGLERTLVRRHLERCAECRQDLEALGFEPRLAYVADWE